MRWLRLLVRKFKFTAEEVADARRRISAIARTVAPAVQLNVIKEDPDDDKILECAVTAGSDYIVSGDKDLLRLGKYDAITIVSVSDFLNVIAEQGRQR
jgi:putative PIN family toxin of toxin-antitoxin system